MAEPKEEINFEPKNGNQKFSLSSIIVEPLVLVYILPSTINLMITQNLILEESCLVNLGFNRSICEAIMKKNISGYSEDQELAVQGIASHVLFLKNLMHGFIPIIILFFIGSWSDKHDRRKPCILGPIVGELVAVTFLIFNTVFSYKTPALLTALAYSLPTAISGGVPCLFLGVYSYIYTVSGEQNLTMRIGGVSTIHRIAYIMGFGISGIILNVLGFTGTYTTTFFMTLSSLVYGYYIMKEKKIIVTEMVEEVQTLEKTSTEIKKSLRGIEHFLHTIKVLLVKRPGNKRKRLMGAVALLMIVNGPLKGNQSVIFLYMKYKFGWDYWGYGIFYAAQFLCEIIGSLVAICILIKYFKWKDETLGVLAFASSIIAGIIFATATDEIWFGTGVFLNLFDGTSQIALRSLMSKLVQNHELGKTNSIFQISEHLTHLIFGLFYTVVYKETLHFYPGTIFLISSALKFIGIFIFIWLFNQSIKHKTRSTRASDEVKKRKKSLKKKHMYTICNQ